MGGKTPSFIKNDEIASAVVFEGTSAEGVEKFMKALEVASFINQNNVDYVIIGGPLTHAQNSNSVATALLQAAGLSYPTQIAALNAPGVERQLLPANWVSQFGGVAAIIDRHTGSDKIYNQMDALLQPLDPKEIMRAILAESKPPRPDMDADSTQSNLPIPFNPETAQTAPPKPPAATRVAVAMAP